MFYTYVLRSKKDGGYYIGFSGDVMRRLIEHQNGLVDSTKNRRPVALLYYEAFPEEGLARKREAQLKQFGSAYKGLLQRLGIE